MSLHLPRPTPTKHGRPLTQITNLELARVLRTTLGMHSIAHDCKRAPSLRLCGSVFPCGAVHEGRLWYRDESVWHARGRAQVAAVQELVNVVDISGGAVREEKPGGPSRRGCHDYALAPGEAVRNRCTRGGASTMLYVDARSCVCDPCGEIAFQTGSERGEILRSLESSGGKGIFSGLRCKIAPLTNLHVSKMLSGCGSCLRDACASGIMKDVWRMRETIPLSIRKQPESKHLDSKLLGTACCHFLQRGSKHTTVSGSHSGLCNVDSSDRARCMALTVASCTRTWSRR